MLLDLIKEVFHLQRKTLIETNRGEYIYNDNAECYQPLFPPFKRTISTVESLAEAVVEEARRRINETGDQMTLLIEEDGGHFYPDDVINRDEWVYQRKMSLPYKILVDQLGRDLKHIEFIRVLQKLRPIITDYPELSRLYRQVTFDGNTKVTSQPVITNGQAGASVEFTLAPKNGADVSVALPATFEIKLPMVKGSAIIYSTFIDIEMYLNDNNEPRFRLVWADKETVFDQMLEDERLYLTDRLSKPLPELCILLSY
jgi:hypothetical protein